jgi:hypothetical protein
MSEGPFNKGAKGNPLELLEHDDAICDEPTPANLMVAVPAVGGATADRDTMLLTAMGSGKGELVKTEEKVARGKFFETDKLGNVDSPIHSANKRALHVTQRDRAIKSDIDSMKSLLDRLQLMVATNGRILCKNAAALADLRSRVVELQGLDYSIITLRNRLLSAYKRDRLGSATEEDITIISEGAEQVAL